MDENPVDRFVRRTRLMLGTLILVTSGIGGAAGFVVQRVTAGVRADIQQTHRDIASLAEAQRSRAVQDSVRFERAMDVLELAVVAIIEPDGTPEQRNAVDALRQRRRVAP